MSARPHSPHSPSAAAPAAARRIWRIWLPGAIVCTLAFLVGLMIGYPLAALAVALAGIVIWQASQARRLERFLHGELSPGALPQQGTFGELARHLAAHTRQQQQRAMRSHLALLGFRRSAMAFPDPLVLLDNADHHVRWFNRAAGTLLGLQRPGDTLQPLRVWQHHPEIQPWLAKTGQEPLELPSPVNPERRLLLRLIPFSSQQNLLVAEDITRLTRLEQVRRDFVANVSHELRTPLTVIHGYLELLSEDDCPALEPILPEMRSQSQRMTRIVEDLLTISRLEAQQGLPEERVALAPMLLTLEREAQALSRGQHQIHCEDRLGMDLRGSAAYLHSAFSNLVSNAVRYTPSGGHISIRLERHGDGVRLAVTDTGHGIPDAHIPRLAERFYRVSTSRSRELGGTGLGLSIVKHVLHLHQARLTIESAVGRGSTFACQFGENRLLPRLPGNDDGQAPDDDGHSPIPD